MAASGNARVLTEFSLSSRPGNERLAAHQVVEAIGCLSLSHRQVMQLKTAVAEATLNALEHGNHFREELPVLIRVEVTDTELFVSVTDVGSGPDRTAEAPDLDRKLAGLQSPRGWGLFLMRKMVDSVADETLDGCHTLRFSVHLAPGPVAG